MANFDIQLPLALVSVPKFVDFCAEAVLDDLAGVDGAIVLFESRYYVMGQFGAAVLA